jgi:hypothetical protein
LGFVGLGANALILLIFTATMEKLGLGHVPPKIRKAIVSAATAVLA